MSRESPTRNGTTRHKREHGFVAVTSALLLAVLLLFLAVGIDVALWYYRAQQIQRGADAAALAAVIKMPYISEAEAIAKDVAQRNDFAPSAITVEQVTGKPRDIRVTVKDDNVSSFFSKLILGKTSISRSAQANYVSQIELGSKLNGLGTGTRAGFGASGGAQNFLLSVHGYCMPKEDGDRFATGFDGTRSATVAPTCGAPGPDVATNLDYPGEEKAAYTYSIEVPCPTAGQDPCLAAIPSSDYVNVTLLDPHFNNTNTSDDINLLGNYGVDSATFGAVSITTSFILRGNSGNLIRKDYGLCNTCAGLADTIYQLTQPGKYSLDVFTKKANPVTGDNTKSFGVNTFSLVAWNASQGGPTQCAATNCPSVSGEKSMSVYVNTNGSSNDFYLAKLSPANYYRGKRVQIQLWDIGEGATSIQVIRPDGTATGTPVKFRYRTSNPNLEVSGSPLSDADKFYDDTPAPSFALPVTDKLADIAATNPSALPPWPAASRANDSVFNGRLLSLEITIPTNYGCVPASNPCVEDPNLPDEGWWKIRYNTGAQPVYDTSTWTVQLLGDPVHLVPVS
jgi:hypothetical protein